MLRLAGTMAWGQDVVAFRGGSGVGDQFVPWAYLRKPFRGGGSRNSRFD